ncbi:MAG: 30S ribosome-binding factor RbfA [Gammaproteobacteria bacterium]|nr:30S ribosome-binding factor RbfA [Gammaproteobacteria bacterium]
MANDYPRSFRVADQIQRELSQLLRFELKDPRISDMLTVSEVEVSRDLSVATVFVTVMGDDDRKEALKGLNSASGFMRKQLAARLKLRAVPILRFRYDDSAEKGAELAALIEKAVRDDHPNGNDPNSND